MCTTMTRVNRLTDDLNLLQLDYKKLIPPIPPPLLPHPHPISPSPFPPPPPPPPLHPLCLPFSSSLGTLPKHQLSVTTSNRFNILTEATQESEDTELIGDSLIRDQIFEFCFRSKLYYRHCFRGSNLTI